MLSKEAIDHIETSSTTLVGSPVFFHLIDELKTGGAQTHLNTILREWKKQAHFRHVVVSLFNDGPVGDMIRAQGFEVIVLDLSDAVRSHRYWQAQNEIFQLIKKWNPQIVEAHLTYSRLLGLFAAWRAGITQRFAFEQGDIYFNSPKWRVANFIGQFFAKKIIVCSNTLGDWCKKTHGTLQSKLAPLYNCVDPSTFKPSANPEMTRSYLGISEEAFVFCAVGTLGKGVNKRMDICIEALAETIKEYPQTYLLIAGDGAQRADLEKLTENLGISKNVKFLGMRKDVPDVMNISDAFCHAAPFEPFGIVCIEAMLLKKPVIVPNAGGISEIVDHGHTGLKYEVLNSKDLSKSMKVLASNKENAKKMAELGYQMVQEKMLVTKYVKDLRELYGVN
jgi:glycosyltransferase involved in cell wall biosynthesis